MRLGDRTVAQTHLLPGQARARAKRRRNARHPRGQHIRANTRQATKNNQQTREWLFMSALVIKAWQVDSKPIDQYQNFVRISGRKGGLVAWVLSLMGIDPVTTIRVGLDRIEFKSASLAGIESRLIPLQSICSSYYGYHKPWKQALSIWVAFAATGLVAALLYYFLNRTLTLGFVEDSGVINGIRFKRSMIENLDINQQQAKRVCIVVQRLIEAKEKRALQVRPVQASS